MVRHSCVCITFVCLLVFQAASLAVFQEPAVLHEPQGGVTGLPMPGVVPQVVESMPTAQSFVHPAPTKCTTEERNVLMPVYMLTERITGKVDTNSTQMPGHIPKACNFRFAPSVDHLSRCYTAWGFTKDVAMCWSRESLHQLDKCGKYCNKNPIFHTGGVATIKCQECLADLRRKRLKCIWYAMKIGTGCKNCLSAANDYWDQNCVIWCMDTFEMGYSVASPDCRVCNDEKEALLKGCNLWFNVPQN